MDANLTLPFIQKLLEMSPGRTKIVLNTYERQISEIKYTSYKDGVIAEVVHRL